MDGFDHLNLDLDSSIIYWNDRILNQDSGIVLQFKSFQNKPWSPSAFLWYPSVHYAVAALM